MNRNDATRLLATELDRLAATRRVLSPDDSATRANLRADAGAQDPGELATLIESRLDVNAELSQVDADIAEVTAALHRLETGQFGTCTDCGRAIDDDRLRVMPTARRCADDQRRYESANRRL
jgi:DnaK suppressor protein